MPKLIGEPEGYRLEYRLDGKIETALTAPLDCNREELIQAFMCFMLAAGWQFDEKEELQIVRVEKPSTQAKSFRSSPRVLSRLKMT